MTATCRLPPRRYFLVSYYVSAHVEGGYLSGPAGLLKLGEGKGI